MAQGTYIGQAQINMETDTSDGDYQIGDIVVWKSDANSGRHLVEGFDGDKVILRPLKKHTWSPLSNWFVKEEQ
jgi:hypothetical protein